MTIESVTANNRRRAFEMDLSDGRSLTLPYVRLEPSPRREHRVVEVYADEELGKQGFTYRLEDGSESSVPVDAVLEYNHDPSYMRELLLHKLTIAAQDSLKCSKLSKREVIRRLATSASQLDRLLDTTNYSKSIDRMVELLSVLGRHVELTLIEDAR